LGDCGYLSLVRHAQGHGPCDDYSRSVTLPRFIASTSDIAKESKILLKMLGIPAPELRGVGLAVSVLLPTWLRYLILAFPSQANGLLLVLLCTGTPSWCKGSK